MLQAQRARIFSDIAVAIQTGQGVAKSQHWILETLEPGLEMKHIVLSNTANTAAVGELNEKYGLGFIWPENLPSHTSATSPAALATADGCITYQGKFKIMPMRLSANTPERADNDPVLTIELHHCASPSST